MLVLPLPTAPIEVRRVFEAWSIAVPPWFDETYVVENDYWHAWDAHRSVSLTSVVVTKKGRPVTAERLIGQIPPLDGTPVDAVPVGLLARAAIGPAVQPARASFALAGMLATEGRILIVTITSDDLEWARETWLSIRCHAAPSSHHADTQERRHQRHGRQGRRS